MKSALRLVRYYGGGVNLDQVLASSHLMRLARAVQHEDNSALQLEEKEAVDDALFEMRAAAFLGVDT